MGLNLKHLVSEIMQYDKINYHESNVDGLFRTWDMKKVAIYYQCKQKA